MAGFARPSSCVGARHRQRGNRHGIVVVGAAALEKLAGPQHPAVEFDTVQFRTLLVRAMAGEADPPRLEFRANA